MTLLTFDTDRRHLADVEVVLVGLDEGLPDDAVVCCHVVREPEPHYAVSVSFDSPTPAGLRQRLVARLGDRESLVAEQSVRDRNGGRAVLFPGQRQLVGSVTVERLVDISAIDRLELLGGAAVLPTDVVHTRDYVRPVWRAGALVLPVSPAGAGAVTPFEVPNPTPCCGADH